MFLPPRVIHLITIILIVALYLSFFFSLIIDSFWYLYIKTSYSNSFWHYANCTYLLDTESRIVVISPFFFFFCTVRFSFCWFWCSDLHFVLFFYRGTEEGCVEIPLSRDSLPSEWSSYFSSTSTIFKWFSDHTIYYC